MICTVQNISPSPRVIYNAGNSEVTIPPGGSVRVNLNEGTLSQLLLRDDMVIQMESNVPKQAVPSGAPLVVTGHFGIGDALHQRALMRELMKQNDVWLRTCHYYLYHDLIERGLKLIMRPTSLHAQAKTIAREQHLFTFPPPPRNARQFNIGYPKVLVDQHGSILEAMFSCAGLKMPQKPDFSLPIKPEWSNIVRDKYLSTWNTNGRPLMVHRPVVLRTEWNGRTRNPDPQHYHDLYNSIRQQFFVVSIADLAPGREWIEGPEQEADVKLHKGELDFPEMAALFSAANLIFCNAGFAPVLAQSVGTPVIVVYGGRESYRTTQRVGAHLAPTLPIDTINPCDCHSAHHACNKRINMDAALPKVKEFVGTRRNANTLVFGTFYIDSEDRIGLTDLWKKLHLTLNDDCDFLAVDSQSPVKKFADWTPYDGWRHHCMYFNFANNIGHLSRRSTTQGRDGWGRAFCKGLEIAIGLGYEFAVHIEGDSLFRLKVMDTTNWMRKEKVEIASTIVEGMRVPGLSSGWVETGLMFFTTDFLKRSDFIRRYDWPNRFATPTPERWIRQFILEGQLGMTRQNFRFMPWKALRADRNQITKDNIGDLNLDWVTHQHNSAQQGVYQRFVEMALAERNAVPEAPKEEVMPAEHSNTNRPVTMPQLRRFNLGCGTNKMTGWENHDADVDITKRLPWPDNSASHISIEHCVEHVPYKAAIEFFKEALRVLAPGGKLRVTVPSLEQIAKCEERDYWQFTTKWQKVGPTKRGSMHAIIYAHGHETAWNAQLMRDTLFFAGFDDVKEWTPGQSDDPVLRGVEGHGRVIGDKFNLIESCSHEARKAGQLPINLTPEIAVIVGGAECWREDLERAKELLKGKKFRYLYINDHIKSFAEPGVACTLHPDKLNGHFAWLGERERAGLPKPEQVWAHRKHSAVTHDTASEEWRGSTGLFAFCVARRLGHVRVIACGVPMTVDGSHFERHQLWQSAISFRQGWIQYKNQIAPFFRSMSGWTAEMFGKPTREWLES